MSILSDTLYVQNIHEYVHDEGKIVSSCKQQSSEIAYPLICSLFIPSLQVTYKWLSRELDVPVNAAKQYAFCWDTGFNVAYFV